MTLANRFISWASVVALFILAWILHGSTFLGVGLVANAASRALDGDFAYASIAFPLGAICLPMTVVGRRLTRSARRRRQMLRPDMPGRSRVLYLRPFELDHELAKDPNGLSIYSEEEMVCQVLREVGYVVAIGVPGESTPPVGAQRVYVSDDQWQERVLAELKQADLVVIILGSTAGIVWELREAIRSVAPYKLILLSTIEGAEWRRMRGILSAIVDIPEYPHGSRVLPLTIRCAIYFDALSRPVAVRLDDHDWWERENALRHRSIVKHALAAILTRRLAVPLARYGVTEPSLLPFMKPFKIPHSHRQILNDRLMLAGLVVLVAGPALIGIIVRSSG